MKRIMIIESDAKLLNSLSDFFRDSNYEVIEFMGGKGCIKEYISSRPDIVLMETEIGGIGGGTVKKIYDFDPFANIFVMSKRDDIEHVVDMVRNGAKGYITKPLEREELLKKHAEWTKRYVEADNRYKALLPKVANLTRGEKLEPWIVTPETFANIDDAEKAVVEAQKELRKIRDEISRLPPEKKR